MVCFGWNSKTTQPHRRYFTRDINLRAVCGVVLHEVKLREFDVVAHFEGHVRFPVKHEVLGRVGY